MNEIKDIFIKLITANSGVSSKRFLSLFAALLLAVVVIAQLYSVSVPEYVFWGLISIIAGGQGATLMQK